MTFIADDLDAIRAALVALENAKRSRAASPADQPQALGVCDDDDDDDDDEITQAYLLWCGGAV